MKSAALATNSTANGAVLILIAVYLLAVVLKGNLGAFSSAVWSDVVGRPNGGPAFWQWALALIVLYALAENSATAHLFGPLLAIALVAMLLELAMTQPQLFNALDNNIRYLFGGATAHRS